MIAPRELSLTHGQVAWALARGRPPDALLIDQLRYLRQLGVPFSKSELGGGRGNRIRYGFDQLIELGVALFGLQRGMAPREVAGILVEHRAELRRYYREIVAALPAAAFGPLLTNSKASCRSEKLTAIVPPQSSCSKTCKRHSDASGAAPNIAAIVNIMIGWKRFGQA